MKNEIYYNIIRTDNYSSINSNKMMSKATTTCTGNYYSINGDDMISMVKSACTGEYN